MEVLAVIEGVELHTGKKFTPTEIEGGILENILTETDYDVLGVVSVAYLSPSNVHAFVSRSTSPSNVQLFTFFVHHFVIFQKKDLKAEHQKVLSDEAKQLFRKEPGLLKAAEEEFKSKFLAYKFQLPTVPTLDSL